MGRVREEKRRRKRKSQKKEDPGARKGRKVAKHCVRRSNSRLAKAAGAEPAGQMRDEKLHAVVARSTFASEKAKKTSWSEHSWKLRCRKSMKKCTPLWREAHLPVKKLNKVHIRSTFGSYDVEKVHAVVARSTFRSQHVQKHTILGSLLEVEMSKKCTLLWREAHFEVKMYKAQQFGPLLEVEMSKKCTPLWREAHFEVKSAKN